MSGSSESFQRAWLRSTRQRRSGSGTSTMPWRPSRVGIAQSKVSMPSSTPRTRSSISPMPSRWRGRSSGSARRRPVDHGVHLGLVGAQRAADRDAVALAGGDRLRRLDAQVLEDAALDDAVDELAVGPVLVVPVQAAAQPAVRALGRARGVVARRR